MQVDSANVGLNLAKCSLLAKWLGYHVSQTGIRPAESKLAGLLHLQGPNTLKQLRGLLGSAHQLNKFIPNLAALCAPFRNLLKKDHRFPWTDSHDLAFARLKDAVRRVSENAHFDLHAPIRASHAGHGTVLQQRCSAGWLPKFFASRFLNESETRYSTNELELLAVV